MSKELLNIFLNFISVKFTTGQNLTNVLLEILSNCGIDLNFLAGQDYDGSFSMSGPFKGLRTLIENKYPP